MPQEWGPRSRLDFYEFQVRLAHRERHLLDRCQVATFKRTVELVASLREGHDREELRHVASWVGFRYEREELSSHREGDVLASDPGQQSEHRQGSGAPQFFGQAQEFGHSRGEAAKLRPLPA